jgi:glycosyltransferase involved in cell wall biosynthesis
MQRHASILVDAGYEVCLVGRVLPRSVALSEKTFQQHRLHCIFNKGKLFYLEFNIRLFWFLLFCKASIFLAVDLDTLLPNLLISKARSKKLVFDSHEYFTEVPEVVNRKVTKCIWGIIAKIAIPHADLAYTVGPALAGIFTEKYGNKFHCILNVPAFIKLPEVNIKKEAIIFYQGALNEGRGLEALILSMRKVNGLLQIAGEGDLSERLRGMVEEEKLTDKVKFLGFILPEELPYFTQKASITCNLLEHRGESYYYSLANKFFDYIHAGIPQVCANFPEYEAINKEYEVAILVPSEVEAIAKAINNLLEDKELQIRLQNNCILASQVYNLQNESQKLITHFKNF